MPDNEFILKVVDGSEGPPPPLPDTAATEPAQRPTPPRPRDEPEAARGPSPGRRKAEAEEESLATQIRDIAASLRPLPGFFGGAMDTLTHAFGTYERVKAGLDQLAEFAGFGNKDRRASEPYGASARGEPAVAAGTSQVGTMRVGTLIVEHTQQGQQQTAQRSGQSQQLPEEAKRAMREDAEPAQGGPKTAKAGAAEVSATKGAAVEGAEMGVAGEAAAGAEAGAAGAAGPAGVAIAAVAAVDQVTRAAAHAAGEIARSAIDTTASISRDLAQNNNLEAVAKTADAAASALSHIPIVGGPAEEAVKTFTFAIRAGNEVVESFVQRGRELAQYSGDITGALVQQKVRGMQADIAEAQELGPDFKALIDAQTDAQMELRNILLPVKKWLLEFVADFLKGVAEWMARNEDNIIAIEVATKDGLAAVVNAITGHLATAFEKLDAIPADIAKEQEAARQRRDNQNKAGLYQQQLLAMMHQQFGTDVLNIPAFEDQRVWPEQPGGAPPHLNSPAFSFPGVD